MHFSTLILLGLSIVTTIVCAPLKGQSELETRNATTVNAALRDHGPPYCDHEGPGMCTASFYQRYYPKNPPGPTRVRREAFVYDRYTKEIGRLAPFYMGSWQNIFSELPYVVVASWYPSPQFKYAGDHYYSTDCIRYDDTNGAPLPPAYIWQCVFDCSKPGGHKRFEIDGIEARGPIIPPALADTIERSSAEVPAPVGARD